MLLKADRAEHQDPASPWVVAGYVLTLAKTLTQYTSGSWLTSKKGLWTIYTVFSYTTIITWNLDILIHNTQQGSWSTCSKVWGLESKPTLLPFAAGLGDLPLGDNPSLVAQRIKHLPAMRETWVWSLGWEDPLEKEVATHSSILCLENPMDRGAWWATVHGEAKSWTRLSDFTFTFFLS